ASAVESEVIKVSASSIQERDALLHGIELLRAQLQSRQDRLVDAYVDQVIDKKEFDARRGGLLLEEADLRDSTAAIDNGDDCSATNLREIFELAKSLHSTYISADADEKRVVVSRVTSNFSVDRKNLTFSLKSPFRELANRSKLLHGDPKRDDVRTLMKCLTDAAKALASDKKSPSEEMLEPKKPWKPNRGWEKIARTNRQSEVERSPRELDSLYRRHDV